MTLKNRYRKKILWASDSPTCPTIFGKATKEILKRLYELDKYEIACAGGYFNPRVVGVCRSIPDTRYIPYPGVLQGKITHARNLCFENARFDTLVYLDDDVELCPGWYEAVKQKQSFLCIFSRNCISKTQTSGVVKTSEVDLF